MTDLGFVSAPREEAGFFLAYSFGLEQGPLVTRYQPYYEPGESYSHFKGYDKKGRPNLCGPPTGPGSPITTPIRNRPSGVGWRSGSWTRI